MKKMVTATIATLSLGAIGVAQGEAHASENNQSNTQYTSNHANSDILTMVISIKMIKGTIITH